MIARCSDGVAEVGRLDEGTLRIWHFGTSDQLVWILDGPEQIDIGCSSRMSSEVANAFS